MSSSRPLTVSIQSSAVMSRRRLKPAKNLEALSHMLSRLMSDAYEAGRTATRTYSWPDGPWSSQGPWDAELVDHVFGEVQRFIDAKDLNEYQIGELHSARAGMFWLMGRFDEAAADAAISVAIEERRCRDPEILAIRRKELQLMREHRSPLDMLD